VLPGPFVSQMSMRKIDLTSFQVATSETARQINRRIALSLIRRHEPLSRADLARRSGLQRSTVSAIIDELIVEGWVNEGELGLLPRGRRPRFLHVNTDRVGTIGVEVRPEMTTVGLAGLDAQFKAQETWSTPPTPELFGARLAEAVTSLRAQHPATRVEGVGVSLPGRIDANGRLMFAPTLGWPPMDLRAMLESVVGLPVFLENAANACALAELWFGKHPENVRNLVAVTVSEGIGVGLLINGQLVYGANAMAGELGHVTLDEKGPPCKCGKRGCWERYASNSAAVMDYVRGTDGEAAIASLAGGDQLARFRSLVELARNGDPRALAAIDRMAHFLGSGLSFIITALAPEVIAVVGEVTALWDRVGPIVNDVVARRALLQAGTRIVPTDPNAKPRLRGAVALVVQQYFAAPDVA
jgi:predicted NBD/HSP70 family sugar kinase